jgi:hypothetical protein
MSQVWDCLRLSVGLALLTSACSAESGTAGARVARTTPGSTASPAAGSSAPAAVSGNAGEPGVLPPPQITPVASPSSTPGSDSCEVLQLVTEPVIPEMMIVLDRSGSMTEGGRWVPSVAAVRSVTEQLQTKIHFGLALFPDPGATSSIPTTPMVDNITECFITPDPRACIDQFNNQTQGDNGLACAPGKIFVPVAQNSAAMIAGVLDKTTPLGGTPTSETLQEILATFGAADASPDAKPHPKFVLLVTDGMPTCPAGNGSQTTQPDIDASNAAVEALATNGVRTYVIGYDTTGSTNAMLATTLDGFAQRGGTGDMMHRSVEDEQSLVTELTRITFAIASCSFELNSPPDRADHVRVRLDGQQVNLDQPDGFALVGDRTVELRGQSCTRYREGNHVLDAQVLCEVVQPQ